jgi:integrase
MASPKVSLRVRQRGETDPIIFARWREIGVAVECAIGRAWMVRSGTPEAKPKGAALGPWVERRGRAPEGFLTPDVARQQVPEIVAEHRRRQAKAEAARARQTREGVTFREAVDAWLIARKRDDPNGAWEAWKHTHATNMTTYAGRLAREIGEGRRIDSVTAKELRELLTDGLRPTGRGVVIEGRETSRKMRSTYAQTLRGIFAFAHARGWIEEDPAADLPAYRARRKRSDDPLRREEYLTPAELRAVVDQLRAGEVRDQNTPGRRRADGERDQDAAMALLMGMAGLRPGEAIALRWEDVDFRLKTLRVVWSRSMGVTDVPKSKAGRTVPMADEVATALGSLAERDILVAATDLVFISRDGEHVDLGAYRGRFHAAQDRAGISPRRDVRQLRNTFGTVCASSRVPMRTLQHWMGHASISTTEIYASFMPRDEDAAMISGAFAV